MARIISPPVGLGLTSIQPLSGPRALGQASNQAISGYVQTTSAAFGLWRFRFSFPAMRGQLFRRYRGWITALHGGANATRWELFDPDMMTPREAGLNVAITKEWTTLTPQDWASGEPWSNGEGWYQGQPVVPIATAAARDATQIQLADEFWGHQVRVGDYLGITPLHFGLYMVTEVIEDGLYRVWPPLRKALTTDDHATLRPILALKLEGEDAATASRGLGVADGLTATFVEVLDYDVRDHFEG